MSTPHVPALQVSETAIAKIAAYAAITTPGVGWLSPTVARVLTRTAAGVVRTRLPRIPAADPVAVTVEKAPPGACPGRAQVTVRIVATGHPPVLATAAAVRDHIRDALRYLADLEADVRVHVSAFDPSIAGTQPNRHT